MLHNETTGETGLSWFALFASTATLICCALPILLVSVGLGATFAAFTSSFPVVVTISQHKAWVFAASGVLLMLSGWLLWRPGRSCPVDAALARRCEQMTRWNRRVVSVSVAIWGVGFFAAYFTLPIRIWLGV